MNIKNAAAIAVVAGLTALLPSSCVFGAQNATNTVKRVNLTKPSYNWPSTFSHSMYYNNDQMGALQGPFVYAVGYEPIDTPHKSSKKLIPEAHERSLLEEFGESPLYEALHKNILDEEERRRWLNNESYFRQHHQVSVVELPKY